MDYAQGDLRPSVAVVPGSGAMGSQMRTASVNIDPKAIGEMMNLFGILTPMQKLQRQYAEEGARTLGTVMGLIKPDIPQPEPGEIGPPPNGTEGADVEAAEHAAPMIEWQKQTDANQKSNDAAIKGLASL